MIHRIEELNSPSGVPLLRNIEIRIEKFHKIALIGPNGCGKSTLLRHLAGLEGRSNKACLEDFFQRISYIPTRPLDLLLPWETLHKNIQLFSCSRGNAIFKYSGMHHSSIRKLLAIDEKFISEIAHKEVYKLSSGQQAIAALYCALLQNPDLVIADEIFATISHSHRAKIALNLGQLPDITVIFASHDSEIIELMKASTVHLDSFAVS
jgi:ABC-type Mn2+/Zn2+ transport system ATPase subunit